MKNPRSFRTGNGAWSEEEDRKLLELAATLRKRKGGGLARDGRQKLAEAFAPQRDFKNVYARFKNLKLKIQQGGTLLKRYKYKVWTEEEVAKLKEIYAKDEKYHLGLSTAFPDRQWNSITAKAMELGLTRKRLKILPFTLSLEERAFAAGMINGDGSIVFQKQKGRTNSWYTNVIFINTEKVMVDWFAEKIPRGHITIDDQRDIKSGIQHREICYRWSLYDKPTQVFFLEMILPYLLGRKKVKAAKILERYVPIIAKEIADSYPLPETNAA